MLGFSPETCRGQKHIYPRSTPVGSISSKDLLHLAYSRKSKISARLRLSTTITLVSKKKNAQDIRARPEHVPPLPIVPREAGPRVRQDALPTTNPHHPGRAFQPRREAEILRATHNSSSSHAAGPRACAATQARQRGRNANTLLELRLHAAWDGGKPVARAPRNARCGNNPSAPRDRQVYSGAVPRPWWGAGLCVREKSIGRSRVAPPHARHSGPSIHAHRSAAKNESEGVGGRQMSGGG
jgi:hypothetical protein